MASDTFRVGKRAEKNLSKILIIILILMKN